MQFIPNSSAHPVKNPFEELTGSTKTWQSLHGGDINNVFKVDCAHGCYVIKHNSRSFPGMFAAESKGLQILAEAGLPVPEPLSHDDQHLLLPYIEPGTADAVGAGRSLAKLHQQTSRQFGLDHANYIGSLTQSNNSSEVWADFLWQERFSPQLRGLGRNLPEGHQATWQRLADRLPSLLDHAPKPSLLHGDLWSGNLYWGSCGPVFIDPAVYYGDALIELAFTQLFGSFGAAFYDAYAEIREISPAFGELKDLYNIYPLLVHANLFAGSYYASAFASARHYAGS